MKVQKKNLLLHNKYILYVIFIIALSNFLNLVYIYDYYSASIFVLIGFLTSFFSKNMIVIMFISVAFTNIIKYGAKAGIEGMEGNESDDNEETAESDKKKNNEKKDKPKDDAESLSVETNEGSNKEKFEQDKSVVYTSEEEKELDKTDKMILSQEKMLKSMNKYKPLLDTLQGITKNMAIVKGATSGIDE